MDQLLHVLKSIPEYSALLTSVNQGQSSAISGIGQINRSHLIAALHEHCDRPIIVICQDDTSARRLQEELKSFLAKDYPILPSRELTLYDTAVVSRAWEQKRMRQLYQLSHGQTRLQIFSWESMSQRTMPPAVLNRAAFTLEVGQEYPLEELTDWQCCGGVYPLGADEIGSKLPSVRALNAAKEKGQLRSEGKEYVMQDGDMVYFRFIV